MIKFPPHLKFAILVGVSLLVGWPFLLDTFALALRDDAYTHILLILPISASLLFLEWRSLQPMITPSVRTGSAFLAIAVLLAVLVRGWSGFLSSDVRLSLGMLALVIWWVGSFVLCFGSRASRSILFPLCFLFGLVPFPRFVLNEIVHLLQHGSALAAYMLFTAVGVPVAQDGILLTIPGLTVEVAQECSSIRSSSMLLVTAMVLAHLLLRTPWRKGLLIGIAIVLSIAKNGLRIFTIALLGTRVDPGYLTGRLHHQGGIVFFTIALLGLFLFLWMLRRGDDVSLA